MNRMENIRGAITRDRDALNALLDNLDENELEKALQFLLESSLTVTSACGSSGFAAKKFAHFLCCIEKPAKFVPPGEAVHGGMGALQKGNALLVISKGGASDELIPIVEIAKKKEAKVILVTAVADSVMAKLADAVLLIPNVPESDRYSVMSTTSFATTMSVLHGLVIAIMEQTDYQLETFALIHPGGAVGKKIT